MERFNAYSEGGAFGKFTMFRALKRCTERGLKANTVIDVGASNGSWSEECLHILPQAKYLLVEAQVAHQEQLDVFSNKYANAEYVLAAASNREGKIYFNDQDLFGGQASETAYDEKAFSVPAITIDKEVAKRGLPGPYVIKLDTHGYEVPILEGAENTLKQTSLVIIETYMYPISNISLKHHEMCTYMEKLGFAPIEMVDFMLRSYDKSLWQMDTFFVKNTDKAFDHIEFT